MKAMPLAGAVEPGLASPANARAPVAQRGSNHVGMRQFNERVVLQAIRLHGSCAKAELARLTGLTAQTIGLITTRLEDDDLLLRHAPVRGRIGQPSIPLALNPDGAFFIGIKLGRRSTDWLLVDFCGQVRQRHSLEYAFPDLDTLLPAMQTQLTALHQGLGPLQHRLAGVGVAAPFFMGGWHRMLGLSQAQADQWNRIDLRSRVQAMTQAPVSFSKDTMAACVAELVAGRGRDLKNFLYLFVDTFVGGGLVINSHLHSGAHGNAGAVASLPTALAQGTESPDQLIGHASLWELEQRFAARGLDASAAYDERAVTDSAYAQETTAWARQAALALALCVTSGTALLDIEAVVIDGAFCRPLLDQLLTLTREAVLRYNWEGLWPPQLHAGQMGSDARALGGALVPLHASFAPDRDLFLKAAS